MSDTPAAPANLATGAVITGHTRHIPLIGHPIAQVKTPPRINAWLAEAGHDAVMVPMDLARGAVPAFLDILRGSGNCLGCSVTVPHKQAAFAHVDTLSPRAQAVGAVNIIRRLPDGRLSGDMTDGAALVFALESRGAQLRDAVVLVAGAGGGAGAAISHALAEAGPARLILIEPDAGRCAALTASLAALHPDLAVEVGLPTAGQIDIAVNASPLGMRPQDPLPYDPAWLRPGGLAADAVTSQKVTPVLQAALDLGLRICTGVDMADAQLDFQMHHLGLAGAPA